MAFLVSVDSVDVLESCTFELQCAGYFYQLATLYFFYLIAVHRFILKNTVIELCESYGLGIGTLVIAEAERSGVVFNRV